MNRHKNYSKSVQFMFTILLGILIIFLPIVGQAETELKFHVQPQFSENQMDGNISYFDLDLAAGKTEPLKLIVSNASSEEVKIKITPHTAFTNVNGVVEYGKSPENIDPTLPYELAQLLETPDSFILKANETREIEVLLTMPTEKISGLLAGGLRIEEVSKEEEETDDTTGLAIKNTFSYVIGVVVSNSRSAVSPELELLNVFANQLNYRNVFSATLQNQTSTFVNQLEVEAVIRAEGEEEVLYKSETKGMQMAPNSHFDYPISLDGDRFQNGNYVASLTARSGENEWKWEQKFTIDQETARRLNRKDVTIDTSMNWWMIAAGSLLLCLVLAIGYLLYKKKQEKKNKK